MTVGVGVPHARPGWSRTAWRPHCCTAHTYCSAAPPSALVHSLSGRALREVSGERSRPPYHTQSVDAPCMSIVRTFTAPVQARAHCWERSQRGEGTENLRARLAKSLPSLPNASCRSWCFAFPAISPRSTPQMSSCEGIDRDRRTHTSRPAQRVHHAQQSKTSAGREWSDWENGAPPLSTCTARARAGTPSTPPRGRASSRVGSRASCRATCRANISLCCSQFAARPPRA